MSVKVGPTSARQLAALRAQYEQGMHCAVFGRTGSGKTRLAREIVRMREDRGGAVIVFVCKLRADKTITEEYKGYTRWEKYKKPDPNERRILLWPKVEKLKPGDALDLQRKVFKHALDSIAMDGKWCVQLDESLYLNSPSYCGLGSEIGMAHALGRSAKVSLVNVAQRPSHLPLIIYSSLDFSFIGANNEASDAKRLSDMAGMESGKELQALVRAQGKHDFRMVAPDIIGPSQPFNLVK